MRIRRSTELKRQLTFRTEARRTDVRERTRDALEFLGDDDSKTLDPDLMAALLNGESTDLFVAYIRRQGGDPLLFMLNPHDVEAVSLRGKASRWWSEDSEVESQFPREGRPRDLQITGERTDAAEIKRYTISVDLPQSGIGEIAFAATAQMDITARSAVGPWIAFQLFDKLKVDSAHWEGGEPATVFKAKDAGLVWVRLGGRLQPGRNPAAHARLPRRHDRAVQRLLPDQEQRRVVPALARGPGAGDVRSHLPHPRRLSPRQRRRSGGQQQERPGDHDAVGHRRARSGTHPSISACSRTTR